MIRRHKLPFYVVILSTFVLVDFFLYLAKIRKPKTPTHSGNIIWSWVSTTRHPNWHSLTPTGIATNVSLLLTESDTSMNGLLREWIHQMNIQQHVTNEDAYGKLPSPSDFNAGPPPDSVFVIQVHKRLINLDILVRSLERVKGIEKSLVVFSMDFVSVDILSLIQSIRFARTVSIFYPHSLQVFLKTFPGPDPRDCFRNATVSESSNVQCVDAEWADHYGHHRDFRIAQTKNHWLWKAQFVFTHLCALRSYTGHIIFIEEDHYVVEDILHVLRLIEHQIKPTKALGFISLGSYEISQTYESNKVVQSGWVSSSHNLGVAISRAMWNVISKCLDAFCRYDDYNWDWSMHYIGRECITGSLKAFSIPQSTRVYHLGQCNGMHHQRENCSVYSLAQQVTQRLSTVVLSRLYPVKLDFAASSKIAAFPPRANGGWADLRDQALCQSMVDGQWQQRLTRWAPNLTFYPPLY
ncbi:unnamed protein product [Calicophoron daubneyi]|uniref:Alpha-1,6-mannosyl-glycoprotein 2-beta-N-acetylglucosaminyltransferase n=1 Tax=Calicophoron daubneyi TaxID=300641 RepID=A0AAV2TNR8_CALDB